jgi:hypothetical protein
MQQTTVRVLATVCCGLGLAFIVLGAILCPQSLYGSQGTVRLLPCAEECENTCQTGPGGGMTPCGRGTDNQYCNALPTCDQCRCKPTGLVSPPCLCY